MAIANKIPSVLFQPNENSISIERLLKKAIVLIESLPINTTDEKEQEIIDCVDGLLTVLKNLDRS